MDVISTENDILLKGYRVFKVYNANKLSGISITKLYFKKKKNKYIYMLIGSHWTKGSLSELDNQNQYTKIAISTHFTSFYSSSFTKLSFNIQIMIYSKKSFSYSTVYHIFRPNQL